MQNTARQLVLGLFVGLLMGFGAGFFTGSTSPESVEAVSLAPSPNGREVRTRTVDTPGLQALEPTTTLASAPAPGMDRTAAKASSPSNPRAARSSAPTEPSEVGDLTIEGTVKVSETQEGLAGVTLQAVRSDAQANWRDPDMLRSKRLDASLDDALAKAEQETRRTYARTYRTTSDGSGSYRFENLPPGLYTMSAEFDGMTVQGQGSRSQVMAGQSLDFIARSFVELDLQILDPGGEPRSEALVFCKREDARQVTYRWSAGTPLSLSPGLYTLYACADLVTASSGNQPVTQLRSESERIALGTGSSTVTLQLKPQFGIYGVVQYPADSAPMGGQARVQLAAATADSNVEELLQGSNTRSFLRGNGYSFLDLTPGSYAVGLTFGWGTPPVTYQLVELGEELRQVDLVMPEILPEDYFILEARGDDGIPLRDIEIQAELRGGSSSSSAYLRGMVDSQGRHLLRFSPDMEKALAQPAEGQTVTLTVKHDIYGERRLELQPGQESAVVQFSEPASLVLTIRGYQGSGLEGMVTTTYVPDGSGRESWFSFGENQSISTEGVRVLEGLEPGDGQVQVFIRRSATEAWPQTLVAAERVSLRSGENSLSVNLPALYELRVHAPGVAAGQTVHVQGEGKEGEDSTMRFLRGSQAKLDADGRALLANLPAGKYTVRVGRRRATVEVPTGEVLLEEPPKKNE